MTDQDRNQTLTQTIESQFPASLESVRCLRAEILESLGQERSRSLMTRFGFSLGEAIAKAHRDAEEPQEHRLDWRLAFRWLERAGWIEKGSGETEALPGGELRGQWQGAWETNSTELSTASEEEGECWALCGFLSGYASRTFDQRIYFIETTCSDERDCQVVGKVRSAWEPEHRSSLRFFEDEKLRVEISGIYERLRRTHEHLVDLMQSAPDAIIAVSRKRAIRVFNRSAERIFGYRAFEVLGRDISLLLPELCRRRYIQWLERWMDNRAPFNAETLIEIEAQRCDGVAFPVEISLSTSHPDQDPLLTIIARDITERKKLEAQRESQSIKLEATLNSTSDGIMMVTFQDESSEIELFNDRLGDMFDMDPKAFLGRPESHFREALESKMGTGETPKIPARLASLDEKSESFVFDLAGPKTRSFELFCGPVRNGSDHIIGRIWSFRDVTAKRKAERQLKDYAEELEEKVEQRTAELNGVLEELRAADKMKSRFISNVSHEFRTPLTSIHGFTETILRDPKMPVETIREFLHIVDEESLRLALLIEDLLDMSRIEAGRLELEFSRFHLSGLAAKLRSALLPQLRERDLTYELHVEEPEPEVEGDSQRLYRVLQNLSSNAIKFTPQGGRIDISLAPLGDGSIEICVRDSGCGIPPKDLEKIFDRFHQVDRNGAKSSGTGLGLSIVKNLVEAHSGTIRVESEVGEGTAFIVNLPIEQKTSV